MDRDGPAVLVIPRAVEVEEHKSAAVLLSRLQFDVTQAHQVLQALGRFEPRDVAIRVLLGMLGLSLNDLVPSLSPLAFPEAPPAAG